MLLQDATVVVTGGRGFLGSHLIDRLESIGCRAVAAPSSSECDLLDRHAVRRLYEEVSPDIVFHLAARVGGIGANAENPGRFFFDNLQMGLNVVEEARLHNLSKLVIAGTICAYPKHTPIPFREDDLWNGYPEETNAPYGIAKKALLVMSDAYRRQYGLNSIMLFPVNLFGPRDNFDLETSHVIPAMIRRCMDAVERGHKEVELWGDGTPTREFLYVDDCVDAFVLAAERYDASAPVNVGAGFEVSMRDLAAQIATLVGFEGDIRWNTSRPNGQPRRRLDTSRAAERFGFRAKTSFEDGLRATVDWFRAHRSEIL